MAEWVRSYLHPCRRSGSYLSISSGNESIQQFLYPSGNAVALEPAARCLLPGASVRPRPQALLLGALRLSLLELWYVCVLCVAAALAIEGEVREYQAAAGVGRSMPWDGYFPPPLRGQAGECTDDVGALRFTTTKIC